eukprot:477084_1
MSSLSFLVVIATVNFIISSAKNILLTVSYTTNDAPSLILFTNNIDLSCDGVVSNVEITDNGIWTPFSTFHAPNTYIFHTPDSQNMFTLPLSVRITRTFHSIHETISAHNLIHSFNSSKPYDFGSNFCQETKGQTLAKDVSLQARNIPILSTVSNASTTKSMLSTTEYQDHKAHKIKDLTSTLSGILLLVGIGIGITAVVICVLVFVYFLRKGSMRGRSSTKNRVSVFSFSSDMPQSSRNLDVDDMDLDEEEEEKQHVYTINDIDKTKLMGQRSLSPLQKIEKKRAQADFIHDALPPSTLGGDDDDVLLR